MHSHDALGVGIHDRRKRRRRYFVWGMALVGVYAAVLGALWLVFRSPFFRIQNITITGNERVKSDQILSLLYGRIINGRFSRAIFGLNNILIWPNELAQSDLGLLPSVKSLEVEKSFRGRSVVVWVEEREPYGVWCFEQAQTNVEDGNIQLNAASSSEVDLGLSPRSSASDCWWFDKDGFIFQKSVLTEGGLITSVDDYSQKGGGLNSKILPNEFIANMFSILDVLKASGLVVKEIRLNDLTLQEVEADIYAGPKLYFSLRFPSTNDLPVIQDFISKPGFNKLQYLDFRVENRAYYR